MMVELWMMVESNDGRAKGDRNYDDQIQDEEFNKKLIKQQWW